MKNILVVLTLFSFTNAQNGCEKDVYYAPIETLLDENSPISGDILAAAVKALLDNEQTPLGLSETVDALIAADAWEGNEDVARVREIYSENFEIASSFTENDEPGWTREYVWPRNFGIGSNGPDRTDLHNIFAADATVSNGRQNLYFDDCNNQDCASPAFPEAGLSSAQDGDRFMPPASVRGDIARALLYVALRYDGSEPQTNNLKLSNCPSSSNNLMGKIDALLAWHDADPVDDLERRRNNIVCELQKVRNPFVDYPELAGRIYDLTWTDPVDSCPGKTGNATLLLNEENSPSDATKASAILVLPPLTILLLH